MDVVIGSEPPALFFGDSQGQQGESELLAARPTPIIKPKPVAISYIRDGTMNGSGRFDQPNVVAPSSAAVDTSSADLTNVPKLPSHVFDEQQRQQRHQQLSVTFMDQSNNDNDAVSLGSTSAVGQGVTREEVVAPRPLLTADGVGLQGGVASYVQELLSVGVQDRAEGFSRSTQSNRSVYGSTTNGTTNYCIQFIPNPSDPNSRCPSCQP